MLIGYARTSTVDQNAGLEGQIRDLKAAGAEKVFSEQVSSVAERAELERAIEFAREGDTLIVAKPDRLARSTADLLGLVSRLETKGVSLLILSMGGERLDTRNPTSKLMLTILAGVATWEREIMLERQREGIAKAAAEGKYKGRRQLPKHRPRSVLELAEAGETREAIAKQLGMGVASVYRIIAANKAASGAH